MLAGISIWQLLIILIIVVAIFGTKKLRGTGKDIGTAVKEFKEAVREGESEGQQTTEQLKQGTLEPSNTTQHEEDKA